MYKLDFQTYIQLLEPSGIVPEENYLESGRLLYYDVDSIHYDVRAKVRYVLGHDISFEAASSVYIKKMQQFWRDLLSPEFDDQRSAVDFEQEDQLRDIASEAPVITLVNNIIDQAIDLSASDIHFEPDEKIFRVRCRIDGILVNIAELPISSQPAVSSRLKLMARLDIGERRLPQDGRIKFNGKEKTVDLRVSTLPGGYGESIVLRILDRGDVLVDLEKLGMPVDVFKSYGKIITIPHGLVLVTGPTGSGKTTTLYATLDKIYSEKLKIVTVEDPVEYEFPGITQVHVKAKIGLTFSSGLRAIVRQDPDIILIGEIRDQETAEIAIESSLTGHLVFSTLHTNDASGAITRLQDMGIESYLISSSLLAVLAQRLVRKNCTSCSREHAMSRQEKVMLGIEQDEDILFSRGEGCEHCAHTGYRGRVGIYELLILNDSIRKLVTDGANAHLIREQATLDGMQTLRHDGLLKLKQGITTPEEILRVSRDV